MHLAVTLDVEVGAPLAGRGAVDDAVVHRPGVLHVLAVVAEPEVGDVVDLVGGRHPVADDVRGRVRGHQVVAAARIVLRPRGDADAEQREGEGDDEDLPQSHGA
jgi:hypothetical protein